MLPTHFVYDSFGAQHAALWLHSKICDFPTSCELFQDTDHTGFPPRSPFAHSHTAKHEDGCRNICRMNTCAVYMDVWGQHTWVLNRRTRQRPLNSPREPCFGASAGLPLPVDHPLTSAKPTHLQVGPGYIQRRESNPRLGLKWLEYRSDSWSGGYPSWVT